MELLRRTVIRVKWGEKRLLPLSPTVVAAGKKQRKREKDCIASPSACASRAPRKGEPRQNNGHDRDREASWAICIKLNNQPARIIDRRHGRDCARPLCDFSVRPIVFLISFSTHRGSSSGGVWCAFSRAVRGVGSIVQCEEECFAACDGGNQNENNKMGMLSQKPVPGIERFE